MEFLYRLLGALHLVYGYWLFGRLAVILKEDSGVQMPRLQWGIKTALWLTEVILLSIAGVAGLLLAPPAYTFAWLALLASVLAALGNNVSIRGHRAFAHFSPGFYVGVLVRSLAAMAFLAASKGLGPGHGA